jgi:NADP-dependent 3-hydroxy acid dehydrogenase YdfG
MASSADLSGRRVLLVGATGGIGRAVAHRLAAEGVELFLVARSAAALDTLARESGGRALPGDASDPSFVDGLRGVVESHGPVSVLIHAAGSFHLAPVAETDPSDFRSMVDSNLVAPFLLMRAFLPGMIAAGDGHVVTLGSVAGRVAFPENGGYSAAKFGVRGLHAVLEQELRGTGVRCTLVEPAATDTPIWDALDPDGRDDLPSRSAMLEPGAVADAIHYVITRPPDVQIPTVAVQRS